MKGLKTGGREKGTPNKATASLKAAAQAHTEKALATIVQVMGDDSAPATRLAAAIALLDRGHGKPQPAPNAPDLSTYLEILEQFGDFIQERYPQHAQVFVEVLEPFGQYINQGKLNIPQRTTAIEIRWGE